MREKQNDESNFQHASILLWVAGTIMVFSGTTMAFDLGRQFYTGFHNADISYNMALWANDLNDKLNVAEKGMRLDYRALMDNNMTYPQAYSLGLDQMEGAFISAPISIFLVIFGMMLVVSGFAMYIYHLKVRMSRMQEIV